MSKKHIEECVRASLESYFRDLRGTEPDGMYEMLATRQQHSDPDTVGFRLRLTNGQVSYIPDGTYFDGNGRAFRVNGYLLGSDLVFYINFNPRAYTPSTSLWTIGMPLRHYTHETLPYDCHEGNDGMRNILTAAREAERRR